MKDEILKFIEYHRLSTSDVADALGRSGHIPNLLPLTDYQHKVGSVQYLYTWRNSNYETHRDLEKVEPGSIVFIDGIETDMALAGHLMMFYAFDYRKAAAVVVNGRVRDVGNIRSARMPVWASGRSPVICSKTPVNVCKKRVGELRDIYEGGIMVCDDTGVVIIMSHQLNEETFDNLKKVADREVKWYLLLGEGKSTFEITCGDTR